MARESFLGRWREHPPAPEPTPEPMRSRLYRRGALAREGGPIEEAILAAGADPETVAFLTGDRPGADAVGAIANALGWDHALLERVLDPGQRPKFERHGDSVFVVVRAALYFDAGEEILFSEFHVVLTGRVWVVLRSGVENAAVWSTQGIDATADLVTHGPAGFVCDVVAHVVDLYGPVIDGVSVDAEQIESEVFGGDDAAPTRIYRLGREIVDFEQAAAPMLDLVEALAHDGPPGSLPPAVSARYAEIHDRLARTIDSISALRDRLDRILALNSTLVAQRQNDDMKRISSWAAILFAPTVITGVYGMNFRDMPELAWPLGYPLSVIAMLALSVTLWLIFRRHRWL